MRYFTSMTKIQEAIQLAIKSGYRGKEVWANLDGSKWSVNALYPISDILLNPLFWLNLGKALRWEKVSNLDKVALVGGWQYQMHRFIDHLIEGKDAESYFEALLTK